MFTRRVVLLVALTLVFVAIAGFGIEAASAAEGGIPVLVEQLQATVAQLKAEIDTKIATAVAGLQSQIDSLRTNVGALQATIQAQQAQLDDLQAQVSALQPVPAVTGVSARQEGNQVIVSWEQVPTYDSETGYHVYRRALPDGEWSLIGEPTAPATQFSDSPERGITYEYRVAAYSSLKGEGVSASAAVEVRQVPAYIQVWPESILAYPGMYCEATVLACEEDGTPVTDEYSLSFTPDDPAIRPLSIQENGSGAVVIRFEVTPGVSPGDVFHIRLNDRYGLTSTITVTVG